MDYDTRAGTVTTAHAASDDQLVRKVTDTGNAPVIVDTAVRPIR